jgi:hypothetical protein
MSAYIVFTRTKTMDQKELEKYWTGIEVTMKRASHRSARSLWKARSS